MKLELKLPRPALSDGTVPVTVDVGEREPARAAGTSCRPATVATEAVLSVPYWVLTRLLMLILVPAAIWPLRTAWISCRNPNVVARLEPPPAAASR